MIGFLREFFSDTPDISSSTDLPPISDAPNIHSGSDVPRATVRRGLSKLDISQTQSEPSSDDQTPSDDLRSSRDDLSATQDEFNSTQDEFNPTQGEFCATDEESEPEEELTPIDPYINREKDYFIYKAGRHLKVASPKSPSTSAALSLPTALFDLDFLIDKVDPDFVPALGKLVTGDFLNDEVINGYFDYLCNHLSKEGKKVAYFKSNYFNEGVVSERCLDGLASDGNMKKLREKSKNADVIYFPMSKNKHWYLLTAERISENRFAISRLDSFNRTGVHQELSQGVVDVLNAVFDENDDNQFTFTSHLIPIQSSETDCGVAISYFAGMGSEQVASYAPYCGLKCDFSGIRRGMFDALMSLDEFKKKNVLDTPPSPIAPQFKRQQSKIPRLKEKDTTHPTSSDEHVRAEFRCV
ncbi:MAG: Ulp1 family isopeptidase [Candidatus Berkiellales bacterium]